MRHINEAYTHVQTELIKLVTGSHEIILDIGCSTGANGQYLIENKIAREVIGIEPDPKSAEIAKDKLSKVYTCSIEEFINKKLYREKFDIILLGDVLEHLQDPWSVLAKLREMLKPEGKVIASIPNIQRLETLYEVFIKGRWPYNASGIHDKTHLRFFTKKNIIELIEGAGLTINTLRSRKEIWENKQSPPLYLKILTKILQRTKKFKELTVYQYIVSASKTNMQ